jgi:hypothetical protein
MSDGYDYGGALDLFDFDYASAPGEFEQAALGNSIDMDGSFGDLGNLSDDEWSALSSYFEQNPDAIESLYQPGMLDKLASGGKGVVDSITKAWGGLGANGQLAIGSGLVGGLSNYMQQRQRDQEMASLAGMKEDEFNRALTLKKAPTNKVADVNHFKGMVQSLRGSR